MEAENSKIIKGVYTDLALQLCKLKISGCGPVSLARG